MDMIPKAEPQKIPFQVFEKSIPNEGKWELIDGELFFILKHVFKLFQISPTQLKQVLQLYFLLLQLILIFGLFFHLHQRFLLIVLELTVLVSLIV